MGILVGVVVFLLPTSTTTKVTLAALVCGASFWLVYRSEWTENWRYRKAMAIAAALIPLGLAGPQIVSQWRSEQSKNDQPFLADIEFSAIQDRPGFAGNRFWVTSQSSFGDTASPIDVLMFAKVVNVQTVPAMIDQYHFEIRLNQGSWKKLFKVPMRTTRLFFVSDGNLKNAAEFAEDTSLDSLLSNKLIQPREVVRGWVYLEVPFSYSVPDGTEVQYRMLGRDRGP